MARLGRHNSINRRRDHQRPPLPISVTPIEYWHGDFQLTPSAWVGQLGGRSLTGTGTPVVGADGAFFNGRPVAQTAITGSKYWSATGLTVAATGTRPWMYSIARARTLDATSRFLVGGGGGAIAHGLRARTANFRSLWNSAASNDTAGAADTNPHRFSTWLDGTSISLRVDGTSVTAAYTPALTADLTEIYVGKNPVAADTGDSSIAFFLICSAIPTASEITALDAWSLRYWGV